MGAETDLAVMLASITVTRRAGVWTFITVEEPSALAELLLNDASVDAIIREDEGMTGIVAVDVAERFGHPVAFEAAWLTLGVHSALEAVGLTAAVSRVLGDEGIPCNVVAAHYHDHLLVPVDRADDAVRAIEKLREQAEP